MFWFGLVFGVVAGVLVTKYWDQVTDGFSTLKDKMPDSEMITEKLPVIGAFMKQHAIAIVIVLLVISVAGYNLWPRATQTPMVKIGQPISFTDTCGNTQILTLTQEDVSRGSVVIGTVSADGKQDCRRVLKLGTK